MLHELLPSDRAGEKILTRRRMPLAFALLPMLFAAVLSACSASGALEVAPPQAAPSKYAAIVVNADDGKVLYSVQADQARYPASLAKMMTLYLLFRAVDSGKVSLDTRIPISANAAHKPPTKLHLKPGDTISVDTAIRAMVVKSANDVATAVAEYLGGSEDNFARMMTAEARALGMTDTVFTNASGLPEDGMHTTARDMAILALALRRDFPQHYGYFDLHSFSFRGRTVNGHNKALDMIAGADGLKTGYTQESGFNLATSVRRDGHSIVAVVMGGDTAHARDEHMQQLVAAIFDSGKFP